ncbi:hypothetical protein GN956_G10510 [Arapaima gigas]
MRSSSLCARRTETVRRTSSERRRRRRRTLSSGDSCPRRVCGHSCTGSVNVSEPCGFSQQTVQQLRSVNKNCSQEE